MTSTPPAPAAPLGIRRFYTQHTEPLDVEVTAKVMTCSGLDLTLAEAGTGRPMFAVVGKLAFLGNVAEVKAADGALLYRIWQKRAALRNKYKATQGSKPKTKAEEQADVLFHAEGGSKLSFDLDVTYRSFDEGKEQTLTLKTGMTSKESQIVKSDGTVVARITRSKADMWWWTAKQPYRIQIAAGIDASLVVLVLVCMHMQLIVYKASVTAAVS